jgi:hypothetical protein
MTEANDLLEQFTEYKNEIQKVIDRTAHPTDRVPDADAREILEIVKKIGKLGTKLRASARATLPPEPDQPDPLAAGAKLHHLTLEAQQASGGKLTYSEAFATLVSDHWGLIREWQQSVPRRRR